VADLRAGSASGEAAAAQPADQHPTPERPGTVAPGRRLRRLQRLRRPRGPALVVAALALASAAVAVLLSVLIFPHLSINNDEPIYRLQAQTLADGHLFPVAPAPADSYRPWLAVVRDGHYVLKYTPVVPGIHAASLALTGGFATGLALLAAAGVVVTYLLAREVLDDRRVAALAAGLWALSPLTMVQSAMLLPYLPFVILVELVVLGALRGIRLSRRLPLAGAGLALGLAVAARPYDTVLFLLPLAGWLVWSSRRRLGWAVSSLALGLAPPLIGLLAFNALATGSPLTLPFALLEPDDKLGFGGRQLYPSDPPHSFGIAQGFAGIGNHLWLLGIGWAAGGVLLAVLAVVAVVRGRVSRPGALLGAGGLLLCVGYLAFWGAWNASNLWGGIRFVGPFYVLVLLVPLVVLGARGLADLFAGARLARAGGVLVSLLGVGLITSTLLTALPANATMSSHDDALDHVLAAQGNSVVFVPTNPQFLQHPSAVLDNGACDGQGCPDGRTVFALTTGVDDFTVVRDNPGRALLRLRILGAYNRTPDTRYVAWLERLREVDAPEVPLMATVRVPAFPSARLVLTVGDRRLSWALPVGTTSNLAVRLTPGGPEIPALGPPLVETGPVRDPVLKPEIESATPGALVATVLVAAPSGRELLVEGDRIAVRTDATGVSVLAPDGLVARQGRGQDPALQLRLPG
jgi:hypothetical protein